MSTDFLILRFFFFSKKCKNELNAIFFKKHIFLIVLCKTINPYRSEKNSFLNFSKSKNKQWLTELVSSYGRYLVGSNELFPSNQDKSFYLI
ncbi:hypothetical protein BpHYR1_041527 [Brachionus plicatilis]|uniref:Uncharacterized protein n=1 Tax=Brachionus plicatilis TaxID=10195 RepID=A0A3M7S4B3_BRAPC|nr:hypothetical protein BpHYR1_041527 [Brachionus plicatilis]